MKTYCKISGWICLLMLLLTTIRLEAQEQADNELTIDARLNTRGEYRQGGFNPDSTDNDKYTHFIKGQYIMNINYKRSWLELNFTPKMAGVWGDEVGTVNISEAWALMKHKIGFFAKIGRQNLSYDDERILGYDDWTMTAPTHDVIKLGYEGKRHKLHVILAYNQNSANQDIGGTNYYNGMQPYKNMQTGWYHYDTPKNVLGISLLFMNVGMQSVNKYYSDETYYQQMYGGYIKAQPGMFTFEAAYYYQDGKEEHGSDLDAYMCSVKLQAKFNEKYSVYAGYDNLSGDDAFTVPDGHHIGLAYHPVLKGFSPIFGSHHTFYGAMDFFYLDSYVSNYSPGLQNVFIGTSITPVEKLNLNAAYHFFATATKLDGYDKSLGHDIELVASYSFVKYVTLSAGYTFMYGTKTMQALQHVGDNRRLHWAWVMLNINPTIFKK